MRLGDAFVKRYGLFLKRRCRLVANAAWTAGRDLVRSPQVGRDRQSQTASKRACDDSRVCNDGPTADRSHLLPVVSGLRASTGWRSKGSGSSPAAWRYFEILTKIRAELRW